MSTGSTAIPLLKAAPERDQLADRLAGGPWKGIELCLAPGHVADPAATDRAARIATEALAGSGMAVTAEAPVSWPSGAFVRVDRLDAEARSGIERSARFAAAVGSSVLTIHLYVPVSPELFRDGPAPVDAEIARFLSFYCDTCLSLGVRPLIENVPPILRMRRGGVYLSRVGGHWRDLVAWRDRLPQLGFTIDISHAALFSSFAAANPTLAGMHDPEELHVKRFIDELGPAAEVGHVSDAYGTLGEGLPYGSGELEMDSLVRHLGAHVPWLVAEVDEPDPVRSGDMKAAYRGIEQALTAPATEPRPRPRKTRSERFDWEAVVGRRDPVPAVLELQEVFGGRRVLVTGGGGSVGGALADLLLGFRPERVTLLDTHENSLTADRRARDPAALERIAHVLCDIRDPGRIADEFRKARPDVVFHLAAYKHVDAAEAFPEEFIDTNLQGTWNVLRSAQELGVDTTVVASTDKASLAASFYGRTKRLMEQLAAFTASRRGSHCIAVRLVNVLGSAGSASELFLAQTRARLPLTVTDSKMVRYWITMGHAVSMLGHGSLLAGQGAVLAGPADPAALTVGELARQIWRAAGFDGSPPLEHLGIRPGETMNEVLVGPGEEQAEASYQGIAAISGTLQTSGAAWVAERLPDGASREAAREIWLEAMSRPGLLAPAANR
jgi:nucleoside-diphosphate-sugar epimerase/sugar phosphate isomerase/epimerase